MRRKIMSDIDFARFNETERFIEPELLIYDTQDKCLSINLKTETPLYHNCRLVESNESPRLSHGDVLALGNIEMHVEFVSPRIMKNKKARLAMMKCVNPKVEDLPNMQDLVRPVAVNDRFYPAWIIDEALQVAALSGIDIGDVLEDVLANVEAEYDASHADPNGPIYAIAPFY